jgi:probable DNA metabolism protein
MACNLICLEIKDGFNDWRISARELLSYKIHFDEIQWVTQSGGFLFGETFNPPKNIIPNIPFITKEYMELARLISHYRSDEVWFLLYKVAYRLMFENRNLLKIKTDPDIRKLESMKKSITRDCHKMKAFVRFKEVKVDNDESIFMAWHNPDHKITRLVANFFKDRFNGMKWIIMTKDETIFWDRKNLLFSEGTDEPELLDEKEDLWLTYYTSIFNPARIKVSAMKKELPVRHWKTLPESELITSLLDDAGDRLETFYKEQNISEFDPNHFFGKGEPDSKILFLIDQQNSSDEEYINLLSLESVYITYCLPSGIKLNSQNVSSHRSRIHKEISSMSPEFLVCVGRFSAQVVTGKLATNSGTQISSIKTPLCENTMEDPTYRIF